MGRPDLNRRNGGVKVLYTTPISHRQAVIYFSKVAHLVAHTTAYAKKAFPVPSRMLPSLRFYLLLKHASQHDPPSHHLMYDCLCQKEELPPSRQESPYELSTNTSLLLTSLHATSTHYVFPYYKGKLIHRAEQYAIYIT